jgi:hypothetical protein
MGSFIGDLWDDISDLPGDVLDHFKSVIEGPGGVVGIMVAAGGAVLVGNPDLIIQGAIVAAEITHAVTETRRMSSEESTLAKMVFGNSLPPHDKIILSNIEGKDGRSFVVPNIVGESIINLGSAFKDPIRSTNNIYREFGQLLIHELTHVWQIQHTGAAGFLCDAIPTQISINSETYNPGDGSKLWKEYNPEQQATMVDRWYSGYYEGKLVAEPCSSKARYFNHIKDTVNAGNDPPVVQTLSVRNIASSKFNKNDDFTVKSTFPMHKSRSLHKSLIGLRG